MKEIAAFKTNLLKMQLARLQYKAEREEITGEEFRTRSAKIISQLRKL